MSAIAKVAACKSKFKTLLRFVESGARHGLQLLCVAAFLLFAITLLLLISVAGLAFCFVVFFLSVADRINREEESTLVTILRAWQEPNGSI